MKLKRVLLLLNFFLLSYFIKADRINAQPVTSIPVTISQETITPKATDAAGTPGGKKGKIPPGLIKKKETKQEIVGRILSHANAMIARANDALLRLDSIWNRVKSRIDRFKANGKDVSGLAGWIQQVEFKRKTAADTIASASSSLKTIENSTSPKNAVKSFTATFRNVKKALKDYHKAILTVITSLRGMSAQTENGPSIIPSATGIPASTPSGTINTSPTSVPITVTISPT